MNPPHVDSNMLFKDLQFCEPNQLSAFKNLEKSECTGIKIHHRNNNHCIININYI